MVTWIRSYINGLKCCLTFIEIHNQFLLKQAFPHIVGIVVELDAEGRQKYECFKLSEKKTERVKVCTLKVKTKPHKSCPYPRFTRDVKSQVLLNNNEFTILDLRVFGK